MHLGNMFPVCAASSYGIFFVSPEHRCILAQEWPNAFPACSQTSNADEGRETEREGKGKVVLVLEMTPKPAVRHSASLCFFTFPLILVVMPTHLLGYLVVMKEGSFTA